MCCRTASTRCRPPECVLHARLAAAGARPRPGRHWLKRLVEVRGADCWRVAALLSDVASSAGELRVLGPVRRRWADHVAPARPVLCEGI